jgi:hypothetical protein
MARAADRRPRVPGEPELTWSGSCTPALNCVRPYQDRVASPGWRRLPFATPPTAGARTSSGSMIIRMAMRLMISPSRGIMAPTIADQ